MVPIYPQPHKRREYYKAKNIEEKEAILKRLELINEKWAELCIVEKINDFDYEADDDYETGTGQYWADWVEIPGKVFAEEYGRGDKFMDLEDLRYCLAQLAPCLIALHNIGLSHFDIRLDTILQIAKQNDGNKADTAQLPAYALIGWHITKPVSENYAISAYPYLPPEILDSSSGQPGTASDVYALAVTLYKLYTGRYPFSGERTELEEIQRQHSEESPVLDGLPKALGPLFAEALCPKPSERPSMQEFYDRFEQVYQRISIPPPPPTTSVDGLRRGLLIALIASVGVGGALSVPSLLRWLFSVPQIPRSKAKTTPAIGDTIFSFDKFDGHVNVAVPSSDGRMALTADEHGHVIVLAVPSRNSLLDDTWRHERASIVSGTWSPDGQAFASLDSLGWLWLWVKRGDRFKSYARAHFPTPEGTIVWCPGDRMIVTVDKVATVYDNVLVNSFKKPIARYTGHQDTITSVAVSSDGKIALTGSSDGTGQLWHVENGQPIGICDNNYSAISAVAYSHDNRFIAMSDDQTVQLRNAQEPACGLIFAHPHDETVNALVYPHVEAVNALDFSYDSQYIAWGGDDTLVHIYDRDENPVYIYRGHKESVTTVKWIVPNPHLGQGQYILSASTNEIRVWRAA